MAGAVGLEELTSVLSPLVGSGLVIYFIRRGFSQQNDIIAAMGKAVETIRNDQHSCQLANAREFATKQELRDVDAKCDGNSLDIARLQVRVSGAGSSKSGGV